MAEMSDVRALRFIEGGDTQPFVGGGDRGFGGFSQSGAFEGVGLGQGGILGSIFKAGKGLLGKLLGKGGAKAKRAARALQRAAQTPAGQAAVAAGAAAAGVTAPALLVPGAPGPGPFAVPGAAPMMPTTVGGLFRVAAPGALRVTPLRRVAVPGPDGRLFWFGHLGSPVLFSGDISAARRVERVARRAARARGRRRPQFAVRRRRKA